VIELAIHPVGRVMAVLARCREMPGHVIHRGFGVVVIVLVTADAGRHRDVVVAVDVAVRTGSRRNRMHSGQRPTRGGVIELAIHPVGGVMAILARRRELRGDVVYRSLGVVVIVLVTADARCHGDVVVVVDVAIGAGPRRNGVHSGQRPASG